MTRQKKSSQKAKRGFKKEKKTHNSQHFQTKETISQELDAILESRWHGAVNIRGIRYQILYSLLRAFDLYREKNLTQILRLEGIEDLDLIGFQYENEYIQVKSADKPWKWSQLKKPLEGFLPVYRNDANSEFILAVNFSLTGNIEKLAALDRLSTEEQRRIENEFYKLCVKAGYSENESSYLVRKLTIISISEESIWHKLKVLFTEEFNLGSEIVETYILTFIAKFLEWSKERKNITYLDLEEVRITVEEALSRETAFQAYGKGLINKVDWEKDKSPEDFFNGKGTRSGHITADLDIVRPFWIEKINNTLKTSKICILRSSSGQGKSTLLYRYAYTKRSPENIFILKVAETQEQVESIRNYLQFRANLGLPILLLIDDVRWQTRLWASVAQECAALNIRVLVTIRSEDWRRFAQESLINYKILEPKLTLDEAQQVFKQLKKQNKIHISTKSPEWAYEKIREPYLLIEYMYLVTQGKMLEDRLNDQIRQIFQQQEDPAKIEILRRASLAHVLGTPISVEQLTRTISFKTDPQQILQSLLGEYLQLDNGMITGLHWVRSNLLAQILHEGFPNPASTALAIFETVPSNNLTSFISNAMSKEDLDIEIFFTGLIQKAKQANIKTLISIVDGLFEAGERNFFKSNRSLFNESYELSGLDGSLILSIDFSPTSKINYISDMISTFGEKSGDFQKLQEISTRAIDIPRGFDLVNKFLKSISQCLQIETLMIDLGNTGKLLDWCILCQISLSAWEKTKTKLLSDKSIFELSLDDFCNFTQGFYRYDKSCYQDWFSQNKENIICYLKLYLNCIKLELVENTVSINFLPDDDEALIDQTTFRLRYLRSAIPFCDRYQVQGIWLLPNSLKPSIDDTHKDIREKDLPFKSDVNKNIVWSRISRRPYLPDSRYEYLEAWFNLRKNSLILVQDFLKALRTICSGRKINSKSLFEGGQLFIKIHSLLKETPRLSKENFEILGEKISPSLRKVLEDNKKNGRETWLSSFRNFFHQIYKYINNPEDTDTGQLALHNFKHARKSISSLHRTFDQLFLETPDYFNAIQLNSQEINDYAILSDLLEVWINKKPRYFSENILQDIQESKELEQQKIIERIKENLEALKANGMTFIFPTNIYVDHPLHYLPLAFSVVDPCHPEAELYSVITSISTIVDIANFFCFIPTYQNKRFLQGSYQISSTTVSELLKGKLSYWETFTLRELPQGIWDCLPKIDFLPNPKRQFQESFYGLLNSLEILIKRKSVIDSLANSQNFFELTLYNKHIEVINTLIREVIEVSIELKTQLKLNLDKTQAIEDYSEVQNFLEDIKLDFDLNNLNDNLSKKLNVVRLSGEHLF